MATYKSQPVSLAAPANRVFEKFSNLEGLGRMISGIPTEGIPADKLELLRQVTTTPDSISFPGGPVGNVVLRLSSTEEPNLIALTGEGTPVPLTLYFKIRPLTPETCEATVEIEIQIPAMLKPMVNGPLQSMADEFANMLRNIPLN